ncbi:MAG: CinA family protein [Candidatus Tectomicrobia bacterium]|uniref:CinA family protein n=1 Tax=Tectimicrobiota bacterium TaxID=2528274 RepID=A0A932HVG3_UNCTE|nr:CinA family protein [Candidatus Tectomicrobia bacterium]
MPDLAALGRRAGELLKERKETVAVAESSAAGLISAALLAQPGASAYFQGGCVVYTYASRTILLGVPAEGFKDIRPSTEEYARRLARHARERLQTTWAVGETGAAGPSGNRYGDPAGHSCIAVAGPAEKSLTVETRSAGREANMWAFARAALELLVSALEEKA